MGLDARHHRERQFRPDPADADQSLEQHQLECGGEPIQRQRIFADVRVNAQRYLAAVVSETIKRRKRNRDVVPHAIHVDHYAIGLLGSEPSPKVGDHGRAGR